MTRDPYQTLGVSRSASDEQVRTAYRRLVQLHHPDHNQGSAESARRFEEVQEAYAEVRRRRADGDGTRARASTSGTARERSRPADPGVDARMADLERQVREASERARREAQKARDRARRAAREATTGRPGRASDEQLGYFETQDSFTKIVSDARDELAHRFSDAREHPVVKRVSDLIDGLDELASKLDRDRRSDSGRW
jgi:curved DNA-binding protein CbpA